MAVPAPPSVQGWLSERLNWGLTPRARAIAAVDGKGRLRGMVAFDGWTQGSAQVHIALESPLALRALLVPALRYVFEDAGRDVLLGAVSAGNAKSLRLARRLGFQETHRTPNGHAPGVDLVHLELHRHACRFLQSEKRAA